MNLPDALDRLDLIVQLGRQTRHHGPAVATPDGVAVRVEDVRSHAQQWGGDTTPGPDGSPEDVRRSATQHTDMADTLTDTATFLQTEVLAVDDVLHGDAADATEDALRAFADLASLEATGLRIVADALHTYARALDEAQQRHARHAQDLDDARTAAYALHVPPPSPDPDVAACHAVLAQADGVLDAAIDAATGCQDALRSVLDAESVLRRSLGDAAGHARLAAFTPTTATTTVDAVLAISAGVHDPDLAVVSPDEAAAYVAARETLTPAERDALDAALADASTAEARQLIVSALATGAGIALTLALAHRLGELSGTEVRRIATLGLVQAREDREGKSVRLADGTVVQQQSGTTCGSTTLLMLAAQRDPFLALFLAKGELVDGHVPAYVADVTMVDRMPEADISTAQRLDDLQTAIRKQTNQFTGWPGSVVGSAPWGYGDEVSRVLGRDVAVEYSIVTPLDDPTELVERAVAAVDGGTPVPFLVGGSGLGVPRHYVLLTGHHDGVLEFYEPGKGEVHTIAFEDVVAGRTVDADAFGRLDAIYGVAVDPAT